MVDSTPPLTTTQNATRANAVFGHELQRALLSVENTVRQIKVRIAGLQQRLEQAAQEVEEKGYEAYLVSLGELQPDVTKLENLRHTLDTQREAVIAVKAQLAKICREN